MTKSATIVRLNDRRRDLIRPDQAATLCQLLLPFTDEMGDTIHELIYHIDRRTQVTTKWTFVMLSPSQNATIVNFLIEHSKRPMQAVRLWALCFEHLNNETGEIMLRREEIAEQLAIPGTAVSEIMSELKSRNAIITRRSQVRGMRGQGIVRYFMNPTVATHLPGKARQLAQDAAPAVTRPEPKILQLRAQPSRAGAAVKQAQTVLPIARQ
jgi:hypothetical protein